MAMPAAVKSSGADTAAAALISNAARSPSRPSQFSNALPPSETPTAYSGADGSSSWIADSIQPIST
jgi:hypothetical protein